MPSPTTHLQMKEAVQMDEKLFLQQETFERKHTIDKIYLWYETYYYCSTSSYKLLHNDWAGYRNGWDINWWLLLFSDDFINICTTATITIIIIVIIINFETSPDVVRLSIHSSGLQPVLSSSCLLKIRIMNICTFLEIQKNIYIQFWKFIKNIHLQY